MGAVVAALTFWRTVTGLWQAGPGRRLTWTRKFGKLAPRVRPDYVEQLFGQPAFELRADAEELTGLDADPTVIVAATREVTERVWPLANDGYLVTWSGESEVIAYSLTTTNRRFHPKIRIGSELFSNGVVLTVHLGRTRFADLVAALHPNHLVELASWKGARRHEYYETYYFGNPGHYRSWSCGASGAGYQRREARAMGSLGPDGSVYLDAQLLDRLPKERRDQLADFRSRAVVNSLMIQGMGSVRVCRALPRSGPDHDVVRTLGAAPGVFDRFRHRLWLRRLNRQLDASVELEVPGTQPGEVER
ncbi:ETEC_3214 domain-containing protein [Streptomyces sp. NPDC020096]